MAEETPKTPAEPAATDSPGDAAAAIDLRIGANLEHAAAAPPGTPTQTPAANPAGTPGGRPAWHDEPLANFLTDASGRVILDSKGRPKRRGGKPARAKPGEALAGGGFAPGGPGEEASAAGSAVDDGAPPADAGAGPDPAGGLDLGPEAGHVIADGVLNTAAALGGEKAAPTPAERASIRRAASAATSGARLSPWLALVVLGGLYLARVVVVSRSSRRPQAAAGDSPIGSPHAHPDSRNDGLRKEPVLQGPLWRYPGDGAARAGL